VAQKKKSRASQQRQRPSGRRANSHLGQDHGNPEKKQSLVTQRQDPPPTPQQGRVGNRDRSTSLGSLRSGPRRPNDRAPGATKEGPGATTNQRPKKSPEKKGPSNGAGGKAKKGLEKPKESRRTSRGKKPPHNLKKATTGCLRGTRKPAGNPRLP